MFSPSARDLVRILSIALPLAVYAVVALGRRPRFRALAASLGATHVNHGIWKPGGIEGDSFAIEVGTRWSGGGHSTYSTRVRVTAPGTPGRFFIKPKFFKTFPDWTFVKVSERRPERVFVTQITVRRFVEPSGEEQERFLRWIAPAAVDAARIYADLRKARVRDIIVEDGSLTTSVGGCVSNLARIKSILNVLKQLARQ